MPPIPSQTHCTHLGNDTSTIPVVWTQTLAVLLDPFVSLTPQKSGNAISSTLKTYSPKNPIISHLLIWATSTPSWIVAVTFYLAFLVLPLPSSYNLLSMQFPERSYQNVSQFMSLFCPKPCNGSHCTQRKSQSSHHGSQAVLGLPHPHYLSDHSLS